MKILTINEKHLQRHFECYKKVFHALTLDPVIATYDDDNYVGVISIGTFRQFCFQVGTGGIKVLPMMRCQQLCYSVV